jgi:hypothetical protein
MTGHPESKDGAGIGPITRDMTPGRQVYSDIPQVRDLVRKFHRASLRAQMGRVLHLAQLALGFRQSFVVRHFLHQRGNRTTESLD